jgi:putative transposase
MGRMQAFKYELQPDGEQEHNMCRISGTCRFTFNKALTIQKENYEAGNKFISYVAMAKQLTKWRNSVETPWLKEAPCHALQHALNKWFVSVQTEREVNRSKQTATNAVGIDVGIARFATLSDGNYVVPLNSFKKHQERLRRYQRRMARKIKFSNNWKKAKAKIQKVHIDIGNARKDFLHKTTTTISKNHALVCVEDLQIKNMSKTVVGTKEQPGKQVRQKSNLNRSILDQGWGMFRSQLEYKLDWNGGMLLAVPPENTSRTCPNCDHTSEHNRKTQSQFACVSCGYKNNADIVGAINILERGHRLLACGEMVHLDRSKKQEPTEVKSVRN